MQFATMMMEEAKHGGLSALALSMPFDEATDLFDAVDAGLTLDGLAILAERALAA